MGYLQEILIFFFGLSAGYFTSYIKEKGKNHALKEDIEKLENQKQKVQIKYTKEIESLKKDNTLEVELRKHKYQQKKDQFAKFFTLLDEFHNKSNKKFLDEFGPIFSKFMESSLNENADAQNSGVSVFNQEMSELTAELHKESLKLSTETNSIRLISSEAMDVLLDRLNKNVSEATDCTQEMFSLMTKPEFFQDQSIIQPLTQKAEIKGKEIIEIRDKIRKQMKVELDEI